MRQSIRVSPAMLGALATALFAGNALAAAQRTFVASTGIDTNACSITAPCRGFAAAVAKTAAGGEVLVLDSAGYGPVTITQSISLLAPAGVYAGVTVSAGDGITVNAPGINVILRGITVNGLGGMIGINLLNAAALRVENCVVSSMNGPGIRHTAVNAQLVVLDTIVRDNLGTGIDIAADTSAVLERVRSERNSGDGFHMIAANASANATIVDSTFAFNGGNGIGVDTSAVLFSIPRVHVERSTLTDNLGSGFVLNASNSTSIGSLMRNAIHRNSNYGINVVTSASPNSSALATLSENAVTGNAIGIKADGPNNVAYVGSNHLANFGTDFVQANGAIFYSYRNNVGAFTQFGTISTATGL